MPHDVHAADTGKRTPPSASLPNPREWLLARTQTGKLLAQAFIEDGRYFARDGDLDYALIGQTLAEAQDSPKRSELPYHGDVVKAWLNGNALPPSKIIQTTKNLAESLTMPPGWSEQLEDVYEEACFDPYDAQRTFVRELILWLAVKPSLLRQEYAELHNVSPDSRAADLFMYAFHGRRKTHISTKEIGDVFQHYHHLPEETSQQIQQIFKRLWTLNNLYSTQPTELSITLTAMQRESRLTDLQLAEILERKGIGRMVNGEFKRIATSKLAEWKSGWQTPDMKTLQVLDDIFHARGVSMETDLSTLGEYKRYHDAERIWRIADRDDDLGMMFEAIRTYLNLTPDGMGAALKQVGMLRYGIVAAIRRWEGNETIPHKHMLEGRNPLQLYTQAVHSSEQQRSDILNENLGEFLIGTRLQRLQSLYRDAHTRFWDHFSDTIATKTRHRDRPAVIAAPAVTKNPEAAVPVHPRPMDETVWKAATARDDLGTLMLLCRDALGLSQSQMPQAIAAITGRLPSKTTLAHQWETNRILPSPQFFPDTDPPSVYSELMQRHWSAGNWTDQHHEDLTHAFHARINQEALVLSMHPKSGMHPATQWKARFAQPRLQGAARQSPEEASGFHSPDPTAMASFHMQWANAAKAKNFGTLLKISSELMGYNAQQFGAALATQVGLAKPITKISVWGWMNNRGRPSPKLMGNRHPADVIDTMIRQRYPDDHGWWGATQVEDLRACFNHALKKDRRFAGRTPEDTAENRDHLPRQRWVDTAATPPSPDTRTR